MSSSASHELGVFGSQACHCVINVMLLNCVWIVHCTRLIRTQIIVCSVNFHLLLPEFDIPELRLPLIHCSSKYQGVERSDLQGVSCRPKFVGGMTLYNTLWLTPESRMSLREQSTAGCFPESHCFSFLGAGACGVAKQISKHFFFSLGSVPLVLIIIIVADININFLIVKRNKRW